MNFLKITPLDCWKLGLFDRILLLWRKGFTLQASLGSVGASGELRFALLCLSKYVKAKKCIGSALRKRKSKAKYHF